MHGADIVAPRVRQGYDAIGLGAHSFVFLTLFIGMVLFTASSALLRNE